VSAFAVDLDRTLIAPDGELRPRTIAAIVRSRAAGIPVLVATGRMFRSVAPYLERAAIDDPVVCYQGAAVVDPRDGTFLLHETLPLDVAREAIGALEERGYPPNVYVDDGLYVAEHTAAWLTAPPTKLVAVGEPDALPALRLELHELLADRVFLTTSLPFLLEVGSPTVSKGSGLAFVTERLGLAPEGIVAFGDGENDVELLEAAAFGFAVGEAHARLRAVADAACPGPEDEGVATVIEAYLDTLDLPA
jgi:hydroxymethylpyrimidine pyrophosphatase-like HAD family hydrolase